MEQTNLVVTPDGQTWDQVTRDVSYIGPICINTWISSAGFGVASANYPFDEWRGAAHNVEPNGLGNKDFAIAYDKMICLVTGQYQISYQFLMSSNEVGRTFYIKINDELITGFRIHPYNPDDTSNPESVGDSISVNIKRGDYVALQQSAGTIYGGNYEWGSFHIRRL